MPDSTDWQVTRKAAPRSGSHAKTSCPEPSAARSPPGSTHRLGIPPDLASSIDRLAVWNIVATVDAFLSAGFSPAEVMRYVHPTLVPTPRAPAWAADVDADHVSRQPAGRNKPNDIFQEVLPNIIAAHVVQSYIGSYGAMIHPVGACATAAVSVEEGVDKIRLGKAELVVAGGRTT
ncbi:beta-ketoacyl synthase, N-terminal domain protein [Mycobacterium xenopi 4042]|uniref:Beta-ketoacyl synthase, N-terminal domain protein n=1 Tax=Mycobacterium xenopi 4042 TaxID=1299334 RepID=X8E5E2_MYCXE|nr:beta-ketoacyl synthase, N-terminal domain protein [Mycobacterium xenopi 4042]